MPDRPVTGRSVPTSTLPPPPADIECRWCAASSHYACPPLCYTGEEHEWGTWTPGDAPAPEEPCTHCDGHGQIWDPTAPGNVGSCSHCVGGSVASAALADGSDVLPTQRGH